MRISAKVDYALQAVLEIASASSESLLISAEAIARSCDIPSKFLEGILTSLRKAGIVNSVRGPSGGYELAISAEKLSVAEVIRAIDGPLAAVRGMAPEDVIYSGSGKAHISDVWIATRMGLRKVLEKITIADVLEGDFDPSITRLLAEKGARKRRKS